MKRNTAPLLVVAILLAAALITGAALARPSGGPPAQPSPMHPKFAFLDENGKNILSSQGPVSTMQTCGQCHDTKFIASHNFHADLGLSDFGHAGVAHAWDSSDGPFGKWNPLTYRLLTAAGDARPDMGTSDWIKAFAARFVGGGPGVQSRTGQALPAGDPDPEGWNWQSSGLLEIDCFLCHIANPNNAARVQTIQQGNFRWASTASLAGTGLVLPSADGSFTWNSDAFTTDGQLSTPPIQNPTNENCAQCHGLVHTTQAPLTLASCSLTNWETATTGQVISAQKISDSGMNISAKDSLTRSWDIHAERGLACTDCHYSLNNPAYSQAETGLASLTFEPRRLDIGDYLQKPDHNLARGQSAQNTLAPELRGSMRRCDSCHDAANTHTWLPYASQHMQQVACEGCHIPKLYAPAVQSYDWTVVRLDGQAVSSCRGVTGTTGTVRDLVGGFEPVLLSRKNQDGSAQLAPYNLVTSWYWVYDSNNGPRPVGLSDVRAAYLQGDGYAPEVLKTLDTDGNGVLSDSELVLDSPAKQSSIAGRLTALGLRNPRIQGEIQPYSVNHDVAGAEWATKDCRSCHSASSRLSQPIALAGSFPSGVTPRFVSDANTTATGSVYSQSGSLYYQPAPADQRLYVFGHSRVAWVDWVGGLFFLAVLAVVAVHAGLRFFASLRAPRHTPELERVYMYAVYERFWHWLQTGAILILLMTGLIIHRPDVFGIFSFAYIVVVHNVLAVLLAINAGLSLFYHLVSGEIRQYLPRPYGFFDDAIVQAQFYLRGIFRRDPHPFDKRPGRKLNPLQQVTYFAILNILLPLQIVTGALMMGVQYFPQVTSSLGGLPFLAPFHSLVAWTFAAFIVGHVYLTTTGPRVFTSIQAMMVGWEDVEPNPTRSPQAEGKLFKEAV